MTTMTFDTMKRIGVSELRNMNATRLRALAEPLEICHHNQPVRVLVPYALYMQWQDEFRAVTEQALKEAEDAEI